MFTNLINARRLSPFYDAGSEGGAAPSEGGNGDNNGNEDGKEKTFEDVMKENADFQRELDRRINQAVETATKNERKRQQIIQNNLEDEYKRISEMTDEEKTAYFKNKAEKEQKEKAAELTRRELNLDARAALQEKKLPGAFLDLLNYSDKDACMKSIDTLDVAFREAVQAEVNERLKGGQPPKDAKTEGKPLETSAEKEEKEVAAAFAAGLNRGF